MESRRPRARFSHCSTTQIYDWLVAHGDNVLTGDSFFHLNALGEEPLPGLNMCGAGRVVCLIDPIGDVYACPFVIHDEFKAGNVREPGGFANVWRQSELFRDLRGDLRSSPEAREIARLVLTQRPPGTPPGLQSVLGGDAVEMLPPFARTMLGLTRPGLAAIPARAATWGMGKTLRWAFKQD